jgi:hypothetical protein
VLSFGQLLDLVMAIAKIAGEMDSKTAILEVALGALRPDGTGPGQRRRQPAV